MSDQPDTQIKIQPKWKPIGRIERRVLGVLVEKAKTTPDAYPLTLNALTNGCNQKSNRDPQMNLEPYQVETALENLRRQSAAMEIAGSGRVPKFRHLIYEWMGIEKEESAVMTELLLRGAQTLGELRGRAARMGTIPDIAALQPIVSGLVEKGLVIALSPAGRGQIVTHGLYLPDELEKVRRQVGVTGGQVAASSTAAASHAPATDVTASESGPVARGSDDQVASSSGEVAELRAEVERLKSEVERIKKDVQDLWSNLT